MSPRYDDFSGKVSPAIDRSFPVIFCDVSTRFRGGKADD